MTRSFWPSPAPPCKPPCANKSLGLTQFDWLEWRRQYWQDHGPVVDDVANKLARGPSVSTLPGAPAVGVLPPSPPKDTPEEIDFR